MVTIDQLRRFAQSLPEAVEEDHRGRPSFRVRGRIFATLHPEDRLAVLKLPIPEQAALESARPDACVLNAWSRQGSTGVRLAKIPKEELERLVVVAWRGVAPQRARRAFDGEA